MAADSIVSEVRHARDVLAQRFNYDLHAIVCDARERQATGGRKVVAFLPKRIGPLVATPGLKQGR